MKLKPAISLEKNIPKHSTIKAIISKSFQKSSNSNIFFVQIYLLQYHLFVSSNTKLLHLSGWPIKWYT